MNFTITKKGTREMSGDHNMYCSANDKQEPQYKELSDEEIDDVIDSFSGKSFGYHELIKACFKKASEK